MKKMENLIKNKEKAQFLSLIIKKISRDRLSTKEINSYEYLKLKVDPDSKLEIELTREWKKAEAESISEKVYANQNKNFKLSHYSPKQFFINLMGKILSVFM